MKNLNKHNVKKKICTMYLLRKKNKIQFFKNFINSYNKYKAGICHDLIILFKGFDENENITKIKFYLKNVKNYKIIYIKDKYYDIYNFLKVSMKLNYEYFFFLNSFSIINKNNWLFKIYKVSKSPKCGLAGCSGSAISLVPKQIDFKEKKSLKRLIRFILNYCKIFILKKYFLEFPNYHIRTNAFMIKKKTLNKISFKKNYFKYQSYYLESGKNSISKQIEKLNLCLLVVGKKGVFSKKNWKCSKTFYSSKQENLMIKDNQTEIYQISKKKNILSRWAWELI